MSDLPNQFDDRGWRVEGPGRTSVRPYDQKASRKATGVGGVRGILKTKLWWREGFPVAGEWLVVPRRGVKAEVVSLSRSDLSRATYAVKKLVGEFPKALPKVVGNAARWEENVRGLVEALKPWVHKGMAPVQSHFAEPHYFSRVACKAALVLVREYPALGKLVDAISWFLLTEPESVLSYLRWVESEAEALVKLLASLPAREGLSLCVQLAHLGSAGQSLGPLLVLLNGGAVPLRGAENYQKALEKALSKGRAHLAKKPEGSLVDELRAQCDWLFTADRKTQSRFLHLLDETQLAAHTQEWANHWHLLELIADKVNKLGKSFDNKPEIVGALQRKLTKLRSRCPSSLHEATLLRALRYFASDGATLFKPVIDVLENTHGLGQSQRPWFLMHWYLLAEVHGASKGRIKHLLRAFAIYASEPDCDLSPWTDTVISQGKSGQRRSSLDSEILDPTIRTADIALVFRAISEFRRGALELSPTQPPKLALVTDEIIEFIQFTRDPSLSGELALQLVANKEYEKYYSDEVVQAALLASEANRENYVPMLRVFARLEENSGTDIFVVFQTFQRAFADFPRMLEELLLAKDIGPLKECGQLLASLAKLGAPPVALAAADSSAPWIASYPAKLHRALESLRLASPDAERIAKRLSKGVLFRERALQRERDALVDILGQSTGNTAKNQRIRLANLEKRIANPVDVSPNEIEQLVVKIQSAAGREKLRSIHSQALAAVSLALSEFFGEQQLPEWMAQADTLALISSSLSLTGSQRKLAIRLFQLRMQPGPWDLREAPPNRQFTQKMARLGIEMSPWIDGMQMKRTTEAGEIHLRFADDPLEVFRMGAHFKTCLSPDSFNFFSVFANAADINKRVLYAYSDKGTVVGRQLLCLNDSGQVIAFHSYSHGPQWQFQKHSVSFVTRLCEKMNTSTGVSGKITTLVSSDWYDDGAIGLDQHLAFLEPQSPFVRGLGDWEPHVFAEKLLAELGTVALEYALPALFRCETFSKRPELIEAIAGDLVYEKLPGHWCVRVAIQLERSGQVLSPSLVKAIVLYVRSCYADNWFDPSALEPLWQERPSLVLSLLRETRERGVRSWKTETSAARLVLAGKSMHTLKRRAKAAALFKLALGVPHDDYGAKQEAREYLSPNSTELQESI